MKARWGRVAPDDRAQRPAIGIWLDIGLGHEGLAWWGGVVFYPITGHRCLGVGWGMGVWEW